MIRKYSTLFCALFIFFISFYQSNASGSETYYINGSGVNIRSGPGTTYKITKQALRGTEVTKQKIEGDWANILFLNDDSAGWIYGTLLKKFSKYIVAGDNINLRKEPNITSPIIGNLREGFHVSVEKTQNNWANIIVPSTGHTGWVNTDFIKPPDSNGTLSQKAITSSSGSYGPQRQGYSKGSRTMSDGTRYIGQFKNGLFHGQGVLNFPDGRKYSGQFKDGLIDGRGTMKLPIGSYEGEWQKGKFNGQGTLTRFDGSKYIGTWKNNLWTGEGEFISSSGSTYKGEWLNGQFHGQGTLTYEDGRVQSGTWENGKFIGK